MKSVYIIKIIHPAQSLRKIGPGKGAYLKIGTYSLYLCEILHYGKFKSERNDGSDRTIICIHASPFLPRFFQTCRDLR